MTATATATLPKATAEAGFDHIVDAAGGSAPLPDAATLLHGTYSRLGTDLVVEAPDGSRTLVTGFFAGGRPADLTGPGGEVLAGGVVARLAGGAGPVQVAQAGGGAESLPQAQPIGIVTRTDGEVFAIRGDGTRVQLQSGAQVFQGDVVQTGADGAIGITFADNTEFSLGAGGRMVLDEMIYDPDSGQGSSSLSLVSGVFSFVSGQIAKTGPDAMQVKTPVATIGIRGTKGVIRVQEGDPGSDGDTPVSMEIALLDDGEIVVRLLNGQMQTLNTINTGLQITNFAAADALLGGGNTSVRLFVVDAAYIAANPDLGRTLNYLPSAQPGQYDTPAGFNLAPAGDGPQLPGQTAPGTPGQPQTGGQMPATGSGGGFESVGPVRVTLGADQLREILGQRLNVGEKDLTNIVSVIRTLEPVRSELPPVLTPTAPAQTGAPSVAEPSPTTPVVTAPPPPTAPTTPSTPTTPPPTTGGGGSGGGSTVTLTGRVIDPYVYGAKVFADANGNGSWDAGEAYGYTDMSGHFSLTVSALTQLATYGGTDTMTGVGLHFSLMAPAGSTVVTPLTTMMQALMAANPSLTRAQAQESVLQMVGLSTAAIGGLDITTVNPLALMEAGSSAAAALVAAGIQTANVFAMVAALNPGSGVNAALAAAVVANAGTPGLFTSAGAASALASFLIAAAGLSPDDATALAGILQSLNAAVDPSQGLDQMVRVAIVAQSEATDVVAESLGNLASVAGEFSGTNLTDKVAAASPWVTLTGSSVTGTDGRSHIIIGTGGNDTLIGADRPDRITGGDGHDLLRGMGGADTLDGGAGNDTLEGGNGADMLFGGDGDDVLRPFGADTTPGSSPDLVVGGAGIDTLDLAGYGTGVMVTLGLYASYDGYVGEVMWLDIPIATLIGMERVIGTAYNDILTGLGYDGMGYWGEGPSPNDTLEGGAGDDTYILTAGNDVIIAGQGHDTVVAWTSTDSWNGKTSGVDITGATRSGSDLLLQTHSYDRASDYVVTVRNAFGSGDLSVKFDIDGVDRTVRLLQTTLGQTSISGSGDFVGDLIVGSDLAEFIMEVEEYGGSGDDIIFGNGGNDTIHAGGGHDWIHGGTGNDLLYGEHGNDTLIGGSGADTLYGGSGNDLLWLDPEDTLFGGTGTDLIGLKQSLMGTSTVNLATLLPHLAFARGMEGVLLDGQGMALQVSNDALVTLASQWGGSYTLIVHGGSGTSLQAAGVGDDGWDFVSSYDLDGVWVRQLHKSVDGISLTLLVEDGVDTSALTTGGGNGGPAISWVAGGMGLWSNAANWDGGVVPGDGDSVTFGIEAGGTYDLHSSITLDTLVLRTFASLTVSGASMGAQVLELEGGLSVGAGLTFNAHTLNWQGGAIAGDGQVISHDVTFGSDGSLRLDGYLRLTGDIWINGETTFTGDGTLNLNGNMLTLDLDGDTPYQFTNFGSIGVQNVLRLSFEDSEANTILMDETIVNRFGGELRVKLDPDDTLLLDGFVEDPDTIDPEGYTIYVHDDGAKLLVSGGIVG
ncbi:FecR domain-containing protein [Caenispirillum bisanense]|uniref:FecR domain-containing protein n=1 Tax=Caenispirillum bisanense TaxID=414052 RepID=UPI0031D2D007